MVLVERAELVARQQSRQRSSPYPAKKVAGSHPRCCHCSAEVVLGELLDGPPLGPVLGELGMPCASRRAGAERRERRQRDEIRFDAHKNPPDLLRRFRTLSAPQDSSQWCDAAPAANQMPA